MKTCIDKNLKLKRKGKKKKRKGLYSTDKYIVRTLSITLILGEVNAEAIPKLRLHHTSDHMISSFRQDVSSHQIIFF